MRPPRGIDWTRARTQQDDRHGSPADLAVRQAWSPPSASASRSAGGRGERRLGELRLSTGSGPARVPAPSVTALSTGGGAGRASMVSGSPTKRSALVDRTLAKMAERLSEATGLAPGSPELFALLKLSAEVVERVVWEVVPDLAEQIIRENLHDLAARRS